MKFALKRKELKALSRFAATKDLRYYLCGIHFVQNNRGTYIEATNGHCAARLLIDDQPMPSASFILHNDAIKKLAATGTKGDQFLHFEVNGLSVEVIGDNEKYTFQALDGTFPDIDRVTPLVHKAEDEGFAGFNPEYVMAFQQAAIDIKGTKKGSLPIPSILQRGDKVAIVNNGIENFYGLLMPVRDTVGASLPQWVYKPATAENTQCEEVQA
jgi:hypothetical protein